MELYLAGSQQSFERVEREDDLMNLYLAGEYVFTGERKLDIGIIRNRLLSFDYQKKFVDTMIDWKNNMESYLAGADKFGKEEVKQYMKLYLAGMEESCVDKIDCNALFSYVDQGKIQFDKLKDFIKPGKLFIDSGAFSAWTKGAKVNVKEYISWLNERTDDINLCGQVDVIPGDRVFGATPKQVREAAEATWDNYLFMRKRLKNPKALLYTYHVGEPIEFLKRALDWTDESGEHIPYIALGGMVGKPAKIRDVFLEKCFRTIRESNNPNIKVHAFGMTDFELLEKYPIYSADSTSWIMVGAMGNVMSDYGNIAVSNNQIHDKNHYSHLPKKAIEDFNKTIQEFGFTLDELAEHRDNRILFNALYMQKKIRELNAKDRKFSYRKKLF